MQCETELLIIGFLAASYNLRGLNWLFSFTLKKNKKLFTPVLSQWEIQVAFPRESQQ